MRPGLRDFMIQIRRVGVGTKSKSHEIQVKIGSGKSRSQVQGVHDSC